MVATQKMKQIDSSPKLYVGPKQTMTENQIPIVESNLPLDFEQFCSVHGAFTEEAPCSETPDYSFESFVEK